MREVNQGGLGLPRWAAFREFSSTPEGLQALAEFRAVQSEIMDKIVASIGGPVTFGELGAGKFRRHWFKRVETQPKVGVV